jgi:exosortase
MLNRSTHATQNGTESSAKLHVAAAVAVAFSALLYFHPLVALVRLCLSGDSYSHILLIPFITIYLIWMERHRIFQEFGPSLAIGLAILGAGFAETLAANPKFYSKGADHLSATIFGLVLTWVGIFVSCYGVRAGRRAIFALTFLLLVIPVPDAILSRMVAVLQRGSVDVSFALFKVFGVPVFREGVLLTVPAVTIEVAKECSSIRSSTALFITCVLAARLYLSSFWKQAFFVLLSLPLSLIKNGIRITTLTLLSIYVNPGFLHGDLHRDGGFVFFLLALAILWPVLLALHRSESTAALKAGQIQGGRAGVRC